MTKAMRLGLVFLFLSGPVSAHEEAPKTERIRLSKDAAVETTVSAADVVVNFFLLPLAVAFALPHGGFTRYPYETAEGYGNGERELAVAMRNGRQAVEGGRQAHHGHFRVRGGNRLGWDFGVSSYDPRVFQPERRGALYTGHLTMNYRQTGKTLVELGLGVASFQSPKPKAGGSVELGVEFFPYKPLVTAFRWQGARIHSKPYHDVSVSAGAAWRWVGLTAGYRWFVSPARDVSGPELALTFWF